MSLNFVSPVVEFWRRNYTKFNFGWESAPDQAGGVYDAPPDPLVGWGGRYHRPKLLTVDAFGVSISAPSATCSIAPPPAGFTDKYHPA